MGAVGKLIIWCPLKLIYFKIFWPWKEQAHIFEGVHPNCRYFLEKFFHVQKPEFTSIIFLITSLKS
jgi:hypothetical protein